jgi:hypothetical protein
LLDEEAAERQRAFIEEQQQQAQMAMPQGQMLAPTTQGNDFMVGGATNFLPAALLAQYPALAGIDWSSIPTGPPPMEEDDFGGRSSFDASSGGEGAGGGGFGYEDLSEGEVNMGGMNGMGGGGGYFPQQQQQQTGDYLSDFEGR